MARVEHSQAKLEGLLEGMREGIVTLIEDRSNSLFVLEPESLKINIVTTSQLPRFRCKCD